MSEWPFLHEAGRAQPQLSLIVMDPLQELACSLTQKEQRGPRAMPRAGRSMVRLIRSSGSDAVESSDHCFRQVSQTAGGLPLDSGQIFKKIPPLFMLLDELFIFCSLSYPTWHCVQSAPCNLYEESWDAHLKIRITQGVVVNMMIGDSVFQLHIITNDSGLCISECGRITQQQRGDMLLLITSTFTYEYDFLLMFCKFTVSYLHSLWIVINGLILLHTPGI